MGLIPKSEKFTSVVPPAVAMTPPWDLETYPVLEAVTLYVPEGTFGME